MEKILTELALFALMVHALGLWARLMCIVGVAMTALMLEPLYVDRRRRAERDRKVRERLGASYHFSRFENGITQLSRIPPLPRTSTLGERYAHLNKVSEGGPPLLDTGDPDSGDSTIALGHRGDVATCWPCQLGWSGHGEKKENE